MRQRITKRGLSGAKRKTLLAVTAMNLPPNSHLGGKWLHMESFLKRMVGATGLEPVTSCV